MRALPERGPPLEGMCVKLYRVRACLLPGQLVGTGRSTARPTTEEAEMLMPSRRRFRMSALCSILVVVGVCAASSGATVERSASSIGIAASSDSCNDGESANGLTLEPSHGEVFYIDTGQGQSADAAYLGYKVTAASDADDIWVKVSSFAGGSVTLADSGDDVRPLGDIANGSSSSAFFFVKAGAPTTTDQTHLVQVFDGNPSLDASAEVLSCTFAFSEVRETIKAAANKVVDISSPSASTEIGGTYVIEVEGQTGKIGAGTSPDGSLIWLSPAARSDWPTKALRLESTSIALYGNKNCTGSPTTYTDILLLDMTGDTTQKCYVATYTFRVVGQAASSVTAFPIAQIASGTQTKHTDLSTSEYTSSALQVDVSSTSVDLAVTHSVSATTLVGASTTQLDYTVTLINSGSEVTIDEVVVSPDDDHTFMPGSARFDGLERSDPATATGSANLVFSGPFTIGAGETKTLTYSVTRPCGSTTSAGTGYTDNQTAFARIGALRIGATAASIGGAQIQGTCGTAAATASTTVTTPPVEATTSPATSVTTSSATLPGVVNSRGRSNVPVRFFYSVNADLSDYSVATASNASGDSSLARSVNLTGLTAGTTYYFRVRIGGSATLFPTGSGDLRLSGQSEPPLVAMSDETADGETLSFTTTQVAGTPTVSTATATNVSSDLLTATLNGEVDANSTSTKVLFEWATDSSGGSCSSLGSLSSAYAWSDADDDGVYDPGEEDVLLGAYPSAVSLDISGLTNPADYCFRVVGLHDGNYSTRVEGSWASFAVGTLPSTTTTSPSSTTTSVAPSTTTSVAPSTTSPSSTTVPPVVAPPTADPADPVPGPPTFTG